jgi:phenylalanyl-tRNA synthetase beta chain
VDGELSVAGVSQPLRLAGAAFGGALPEQWASPKRVIDFFDVKADLAAVLPDNVRFEPAEHPLLHPGRSARIVLDDKTVGWLGELHPRHLARFELPSAPIVFELDVAPLQKLPVVSHVPVSKQPLVRRDMALVVANAVNSDALVGALRAAAPAYVRGVEVFDVYRGAGLTEGTKSVAIRVLMQDTERTLADTEIEGACQQMLLAAQQHHGATLRT